LGSAITNNNNNIIIIIEKNEMGGSCSVYVGGERGSTQGVGEET
jgi:hypothetical protein